MSKNMKQREERKCAHNHMRLDLQKVIEGQKIPSTISPIERRIGSKYNLSQKKYVEEPPSERGMRGQRITINAPKVENKTGTNYNSGFKSAFTIYDKLVEEKVGDVYRKYLGGKVLLGRNANSHSSLQESMTNKARQVMDMTNPVDNISNTIWLNTHYPPQHSRNINFKHFSQNSIPSNSYKAKAKELNPKFSSFHKHVQSEQFINPTIITQPPNPSSFDDFQIKNTKQKYPTSITSFHTKPQVQPRTPHPELHLKQKLRFRSETNDKLLKIAELMSEVQLNPKQTVKNIEKALQALSICLSSDGNDIFTEYIPIIGRTIMEGIYVPIKKSWFKRQEGKITYKEKVEILNNDYFQLQNKLEENETYYKSELAALTQLLREKDLLIHASLTKTATQQEEETLSLKQRIFMKTNELEGQRKQIGQLHAENRGITMLNEELKNKISRFQHKTEQNEKSLSTLANENTSLQNKFNTLEITNAQAMAILDESKGMVNDQQNKLEIKGKRESEFKKEINSLVSKIGKLRADNKKLTDTKEIIQQLTPRECNFSELFKELELKEPDTGTINELGSQGYINQLFSIIIELRTNLAELQSQKLKKKPSMKKSKTSVHLLGASSPRRLKAKIVDPNNK